MDQYVYVDLCACSIYHKKRTSFLVLDLEKLGEMPPEWRQNPHFRAYMDRWAERYV
jgi:hypothetical protein